LPKRQWGNESKKSQLMLKEIKNWIILNKSRILRDKLKTGLLFFNGALFILAVAFYHLGILPIEKTGDLIFWLVLIFALALYRPGWAFLFFVGAIVLENISLTMPEIGLTLRIYQALGALIIGAVLIRIALKKSGLNLFHLEKPDYLILAFWISSLLSALFSAEKGASLKITLIIFSFTALYFLVRLYVQDRIDLKKIIPFFLVASLGVIIYGILQNIFFIQGFSFHEEVMPGRPNATFTEPDWLGIYLVLLLAVIYALIYYFNKIRDSRLSLISNDQFSISPAAAGPRQGGGKQISNLKVSIENVKIFFSYFYLILVYILLILTVSRSAWLGAGFITLVFLKAVLTNFSWHLKNWRWKMFLQQAVFVAFSGAVSVLVVYSFNLTSFQLFDRAQSTGTGLQKITVACKENVALPEKINSSEELIRYGCRHINLEEIRMEEKQGNQIKEIYRPDPNVNIRGQIFQKSWEIIKKNPILGVGYGSIASFLGQDERGTNLNSSNIFLEVWLGSGILGLVAFIALWIYILLKSMQLFFKAEEIFVKSFALFGIISWVGLTIPNLFNAGIFLGFLWVWMAIVLSVKE
jgi:O-antigen ligase